MVTLAETIRFHHVSFATEGGAPQDFAVVVGRTAPIEGCAPCAAVLSEGPGKRDIHATNADQ